MYKINSFYLLDRYLLRGTSCCVYWNVLQCIVFRGFRFFKIKNAKHIYYQSTNSYMNTNSANSIYEIQYGYTIFVTQSIASYWLIVTNDYWLLPKLINYYQPTTIQNNYQKNLFIDRKNGQADTDTLLCYRNRRYR